MGRARVWTPSQPPGLCVHGFWVLRRPLTARWGSDHVWRKIEQHFGRPDAAFGVTDGVPTDELFPVLLVDRRFGYEWAELPLVTNTVNFGYWDPPYDKLYKREAQEIWRVCRRLAILHTHVYPRSWFAEAVREAMIAITMGPLKQLRCLQLFRKP